MQGGEKQIRKKGVTKERRTAALNFRLKERLKERFTK